jgi:cytochrome c peroxidase
MGRSPAPLAICKSAFTTGRAVSVGSTGEKTPSNAPSIANAGWHEPLTWANPALVTLERQMENPLFGERPIEMGLDDANKMEVVARFCSDAEYRKWFTEAFPEKVDPISMDTIIKAISAFQRGVISFDSRYDHYLQGKIKFTGRSSADTISISARRRSAITVTAALISTISSCTPRRARRRRPSTTRASTT